MEIGILNFFQDTNSRGVESWAVELKKNITKHRIDIFSEKKARSQNRSHLTLLQRFFLDTNSLKIAIWTISVLPRLKNKAIVIPTNGGWQTLIVRMYCLLTSKKMVVVGHSGVGWDDGFNLLCSPNIFVALTKKSLDWANKVNPLVRKIIIPNGVDTKKFTPSGESYATGITGKFEVILCVSALESTKGIFATIDAVSKLPKKYFLLLVGTGSLKNQIIKYASKKLKDRYMLMSESYERMPMIYRSAKIFTSAPYENEAFGIVFLEAMASGLPVVTNDFPSRRQILGDAGVYFKDKDVESYKDALLEAFNNHKRFSAAAILQARKYNWESQAMKYQNLFEEI